MATMDEYFRDLDMLDIDGPTFERPMFNNGLTDETAFSYEKSIPKMNINEPKQNQFSDFLINQTGSVNPNLLNSFELLPTPDKIIQTNVGRGLQQSPVLLNNDMQNRGGLLDDVQMFYRSLLQ
tara:strand:- start:7591 stop:7959 length:369 start_codon:yes stop_codon:yes gene_type:complete